MDDTKDSSNPYQVDNSDKIIDTANRNKTENRIIPGRFVKGISGNPSGRPNIPLAFKQLAQENAMPALQVAIEIMENPKERTVNRLKAIEIILNRALGLPVQAITGGIGSDGEEKPMTVELIARLLGGSK